MKFRCRSTAAVLNPPLFREYSIKTSLPVRTLGTNAIAQILHAQTARRMLSYLQKKQRSHSQILPKESAKMTSLRVSTSTEPLIPSWQKIHAPMHARAVLKTASLDKTKNASSLLFSEKIQRASSSLMCSSTTQLANTTRTVLLMEPAGWMEADAATTKCLTAMKQTSVPATSDAEMTRARLGARKLA